MPVYELKNGNFDQHGHIIRCSCHTSDHQFEINWWESEDKEVYFTIHLNDTYSFWNRLVLGIKYIFGFKSRYGNFAEIILMPEDCKEVSKILDEAVKTLEKDDEC